LSHKKCTRIIDSRSFYGEYDLVYQVTLSYQNVEKFAVKIAKEDYFNIF